MKKILIFTFILFSNIYAVDTATPTTPATTTSATTDAAPKTVPATDLVASKQLTLSELEKEILKEGELSILRYIAGGLLGTVSGFGLGHIIHGRWLSKGYLFTIGKLVLNGLVSGCTVANSLNPSGSKNGSKCNSKSEMEAAFVAIKLWEVFDVWNHEYQRRKKHRNLKKK